MFAYTADVTATHATVLLRGRTRQGRRAEPLVRRPCRVGCVAIRLRPPKAIRSHGASFGRSRFRSYDAGGCATRTWRRYVGRAVRPADAALPVAAALTVAAGKGSELSPLPRSGKGPTRRGARALGRA